MILAWHSASAHTGQASADVNEQIRVMSCSLCARSSLKELANMFIFSKSSRIQPSPVSPASLAKVSVHFVPATVNYLPLPEYARLFQVSMFLFILLPWPFLSLLLIRDSAFIK